MATTSLFEFAKNFISNDGTTKKIDYYAEYDNYFKKNNFTPSTILEIGVYNGESTKVFSRVYPNAKIIALDVQRREIDFSDFPNITYIQADQTDRSNVEAIVKREFPDGIDLILEDASHIGAFSAITFNTLIPFLNNGGVYVIEDWGTGYWDTWPDGSRYQEYPLKFYAGVFPKRIPSHDFGMVGFVKSLVDLTSVKPIEQDPSKHNSRLKSLEFTRGICFAMKA
jgi:FtsJ-like methyltransferase